MSYTPNHTNIYPAATFHDDAWWPVLEMSGRGPMRATRCCFSSHSAAVAAAKDIIEEIDKSVREQLIKHMCERLGK